MTQPMQPSLRPVRLPEAVLEAFFPAPALLAGRPAASSVAIYTRDCTAYVAFCGDDSTLALCTETLRCWRTYLVQNIPVSPPTMNRMLAAVKRVMKEGLLVAIVELHAQGVSISQISKVLAIGYRTAWNYVQRCKKSAGVVQGTPVVCR